jgi:hypothetical protein
MRPGVDRPRTTMFTGASPVTLARSPTANYRASVARTEGISTDMDYTPPSPGFFNHDSSRSRDSTLIDPMSPQALPVSPPTLLHRASIACEGSPPEATDQVPPSPGFFQVDEDGPRSRRTTLMTPPAPILVPPPSPSARSHHSETSRRSPLSANYTEDIQQEHIAPAMIALPQSPSIRSHQSDTGRNSPLSASHNEDSVEGVETIPPSPGFLLPGQGSPITPPNLPPPSRFPLPAGYRMSVARTEGLNGGMEFRRPTPGFMQGDRPRSMA